MASKSPSEKYMKPDINVFIFRRDLRVQDNTALLQLLDHSKAHKLKVLPIFIFNSKQIEPTKNPYFSNNAVQFMIESLKDLKISLYDSLIFFHGDDEAIIKHLLNHFRIDTIAFNKDHTPFAKSRDEALITFCVKNGINTIATHDYTLFEEKPMTASSGTPYSVFTPFYRACLANINKVPKAVLISNYKNLLYYSPLPKTLNTIKNIDPYHTPNPNIKLHGTREDALKILARIKNHSFKDYDKNRDFPAKDATTKLSPYLKFGLISIREAFYTILNSYGKDHGLVRELIWREFYANIAEYFPRVLERQLQVNRKQNKPFKERYDTLKWTYNKSYHDAFVNARTGFPIIDASIRNLKTTGFLHNRLRMVIASFFTKDLLLDWRLGEEFYAQHAIDYDPASNNGGWSWSASVGVDAAMPTRIFSPHLQSEKFDANAEYIKTWMPELKDIPAKHLHHWDEFNKLYPDVKYPEPIINHDTQRKKAIKFYS